MGLGRPDRTKSATK